MMEEEAYMEPGSYAEEGDSWAVQPGSGIAYPVATAQACGLPSTRLGGAPAYAPLAWGSMAAAEYEQVTGWQVVTDLDGAGGQYIAGRLMAAWWGGRVWLKLTTETSSAEGAEDAAEPPSGAGYVGMASSCDLPADAPSRAVLPQLYICPMDAREDYLKTEQGAWRADVFWEVLANYSYHPEEGVWQALESGGYAYKQAMRVTIWAVACGNVLCFHTTASPMYTDDLEGAAPVAARLAHSAWGLPYEMTGYDLDALTAEGGPFSPFWCAQLPWELDSTTPATLDDSLTQQPALGGMGTENYLGTADDSPAGRMTPPAIAAPVHICGRFHFGGPWGIALRQVVWPWEYGAVYGDLPSVYDFTGYDTWLDAVQGYMVDAAEPQDHAESAQDYCFDPASIEGKGVLMGYCVGWYTPGTDAWPPTAAPYEVLTAAELASPHGRFFLAIAGTSADGVLLTASCFAEPGPDGGGDDPDPTPAPGPGPEPGPVPDPEPNPTPGPGPWNPPGPSPDPDDPDDPDPGPGAEWLAPGYYFTGGKGIKVTADRTTVRVDGEVTAIRYDFAIDVTQHDLFATASTRYKATVNMATSNGDSYDFNGTSCTMYYGFTASSYEGSVATVSWKSSYMYSDTDSKTTTAYTYVVGEVVVAADFPQSGAATSESVPTSNILAIRDTGRTTTRSSGGKKRLFHVYTIALKWGTLKGIMLRKALSHTPRIQVSSASATGTNGGPPDPPTVTASAGTVAVAHANGYSDFPASVTGCLIPSLAADYSGTANGTTGVSARGSSTWLHGDSERVSGSIDAYFSVTLPDQSTDL